MSKSNPPRDHHYVPKLLLMRFVSTEGTLFIYDLDKKAIYPGRPETAGFVRDLYSCVGPGGNQDHEYVEKLMAERVDGPGDAAIKRLLAQEDFGAMGAA